MSFTNLRLFFHVGIHDHVYRFLPTKEVNCWSELCLNRKGYIELHKILMLVSSSSTKGVLATFSKYGQAALVPLGSSCVCDNLFLAPCCVVYATIPASCFKKALVFAHALA